MASIESMNPPLNGRAPEEEKNEISKKSCILQIQDKQLPKINVIVRTGNVIITAHRLENKTLEL